MNSKKVLFNTEARDKILKGVTILAQSVKSTLGPRGRNVAIEREYGPPLITKDGVTVAKEIKLSDPFENMGVQMVKEASSRTNDIAGDGTTTAIVLAEAIYREGLKNVAAGANPVYMKRGIDKAVSAIVTKLSSISKKISDTSEIRQVATVSANWDETIGEIVAEAMNKVGRDGTITVESANSMETTLEVVEGMQFDKGYLSAYFADQETLKVSLENALILIVDKKLTAAAPLAPFFNEIAKSGKQVLVIAEDVEGDALAFMVVNRMRGALVSCAVKAPGFGDRRRALLEDIAVLTGGTVITDESGIQLDKVAPSHCGQAKKIVVTKDSTVITGGAGKKDLILGRIKLIRREIEESSSDFEREKFQERLSKLAGGVAVIRTGAATEVEMKEKKDRIEDALHATRAAVEEGIVPGGGVALLRCASVIDTLGLEGDEALGAQIVARAVFSPINTLCENAGRNGAVVASKILEGTGNFGFNVSTFVFEDLVEAGVVDPTKVTRSALQNAASIAGLLLTTDCVITDIPKEDKSLTASPQMM